jgi:protein phosphatase 1G
MSRPVTETSTSWGKNTNVEYGCVEMQGWRKTMEDTHCATNNFCDNENLSFFAVYDGHGGSEVSRWLSVHLHRMVESFYRTSNGRIEEALTKAFLSVDDNLDTWCRYSEDADTMESECLLKKLQELKENRMCESSDLTSSVSSSISSCSSSDFGELGGRPSCAQPGRPSMRPSLSMSPASPVPACEKKGLRPSLSEELIHCSNYSFGREYGWDVGSTACAAVVSEDRVYVANVGDSRCVLSKNGEAVDLSIDHKPNTPRERARIEAAGLDVEDGRVNGALNLSRALGDLRFKNNSRLCSTQQAVTAVPDIACVDLKPEHDFLVIASDGIFDVLSSQEVVEFVRENLIHRGDPVLEVAEKIVRHCLAPSCEGYRGGTGMDNSTVVIVDLRCRWQRKVLDSQDRNMTFGSEFVEDPKKRFLDSKFESNKKQTFSPQERTAPPIPSMFRERFPTTKPSCAEDVAMN